MRKEFKMSEKQLKEILSACKPVPLIALNAGVPPSPQDIANAAWEKLGEEMGFYFMTAEPIDGKSSEFFTAESVD